MFKLYDYYYSSACFRVRIALNLKNLSHEVVPVHLLHHGGEHLQTAYQKINPQCLVPSLEEITSQSILTQSLAIIEYLDETHPDIPLLPNVPLLKAKIRAFALSIACDTHPLNNLRVLNYLKNELKCSDEQKNQWYHHWLRCGLMPLEKKLGNKDRIGPYCFGEDPTLADICLVPQVYNALRFKFDLSDFPLIHEVYQHCLLSPAFDKALPESQPQADS